MSAVTGTLAVGAIQAVSISGNLDEGVGFTVTGSVAYDGLLGLDKIAEDIQFVGYVSGNTLYLTRW
jgi:hypothetical protein